MKWGEKHKRKMRYGMDAKQIERRETSNMDDGMQKETRKFSIDLELMLFETLLPVLKEVILNCCLKNLYNTYSLCLTGIFRFFVNTNKVSSYS